MNEHEVPEAFTVRSPRWLGWVMIANAALQAAVGLFLDGGAGRFIWVVLWLLIAWLSFSWQARITPNGISYTNPGGKDWSRPWSELEKVEVAKPGLWRPLVAARAPGGRRVRVNNGVVRTTDGEQLSPLAVQRLIETWAGASALLAPTDEID